MKLFAGALHFLCALLAARAGASAEELWVLEVSALDAEDTQRLRELLDRPLRALALPSAAGEPIPYARSLGAHDVLVLDREHGRVSLVRADGEVLTRTTGTSPARSPYVVSFVAAELLALAEHLDTERASRPRWQALSLRTGMELRWYGEPFMGMLRPSFAAGAVWGRPSATLAVASELAASLFGRAERASPRGDLHFARHDLTLAVGPTIRRGRVVLSALGRAGIALTRADYRGPFGSEARHIGGSLGPELVLQLAWKPWLRLFAAGGGYATSRRAEFRVGGRSLVREAPWFGRAELGLSFMVPER